MDPPIFGMDSKLSYAHRSDRRLDERVVDAEWRKDKLVVLGQC